jgi:hypothetical protein
MVSAFDDVQYLLGHADGRTTRLYDRRQKQVTRNNRGADFGLMHAALHSPWAIDES